MAEQELELQSRISDESQRRAEYFGEMRDDAIMLAEYAGENLLREAEKRAQSMAKSFGISLQDARDIDKTLQSLDKWNEKKSGTRREQIKEERETRREERMGKRIEAEQKRQDKFEERKARGELVNDKGKIDKDARKALDGINKAANDAKKAANDAAMKEIQAKQALDNARKKAESDLEAVKNNTRDTVETLKKITSK